MNIGIIVHSDTGNTMSVAGKLKARLTRDGHRVKVEKVEAVGDPKPGIPGVKVKACPDISGYEGLIFGAPVNAFSLSPTMKACLGEMGSLKGKKVACYVTKALRWGWTGGNRALKQMTGTIEAKGGKVQASGYVVWKESHRERTMAEVVEKFGGLFRT